MPTRFIYSSLPCTTGLRGTGERGLELMSRQIEVRLFECSQLEEDTFISSYWVSQSLYGIDGVQGRPQAMVLLLPAYLTPLHSDFLIRRNENLSL